MSNRAEAITQAKKIIADAETFLRNLSQQSSGAGGGEVLDRRVKALMQSEKIASYSQAMDRVLAAEPALARNYASESGGADPADPIDQKIHREVLVWIARHPGMPYSTALEQLMDARADLAALYKNWSPDNS